MQWSYQITNVGNWLWLNLRYVRWNVRHEMGNLRF